MPKNPNSLRKRAIVVSWCECARYARTMPCGSLVWSCLSGARCAPVASAPPCSLRSASAVAPWGVAAPRSWASVRASRVLRQSAVCYARSAGGSPCGVSHASAIAAALVPLASVRLLRSACSSLRSAARGYLSPRLAGRGSWVGVHSLRSWAHNQRPV